MIQIPIFAYFYNQYFCNTNLSSLRALLSGLEATGLKCNLAPYARELLLLMASTLACPVAKVDLGVDHGLFIKVAAIASEFGTR